MNNKHNRKIIFYPNGGLGNRLFCLYSALYWIKVQNLNPIIIWEIEYACCARFEELFEIPKDFQVKTMYTLSIKKDSLLRNIIGKLYIKTIESMSSFVSPQQTNAVFDSCGEEGIDRLLNSGNKCIKAYSIFCCMEHFRQAIPLLQPSKEITKRVDEIMKPYQCVAGRRIIGVHIRRTDHKLSIQKSPIELFYSKMNSIMEECNTIFYVATDDQTVLDEISKSFPVINHICFSDKITRRSSNGMKDAYVDMLCLSKCEKIYGSFNSTFSAMAGIIGNIECEVLSL